MNEEPGTKAIIVAAGRGKRLGSETAEIPKCMVEVAGRPILHRQMAALADAGVRQVIIVRGYRGDRIAPLGDSRLTVVFVENREWETNNILASLMCAGDEMKGGFCFAYSDIVFAPEVALAVARSTAAVSLVVDRRWSDAYQGRSLHPVAEAELARINEDGAVARVGKRAVPVAEAAGEFIGLAKFSDRGASHLEGVWNSAARGGLDAPFGLAPSLRVAYLSDALNEMVNTGGTLTPVYIDGQWREIDTEQDLARAHEVCARWA